VTPGTEIATLDDISTIKLDFSVPEVNLSAIKRGLTVTATSAAYPGREFKGEVVSIDSRIDPVTRAITVRAAIPNPDAALKPGMLLAVQMASSERQTLILPEIAVFGIGASHYVYAVDQGMARQVEVGIGARRQGRVEITSGLTEGQTVVTDGIVKLRDGAKIALKPNAEAATTAATTAPAKG
jgi:membrane fusion protein (multidrug efflux system)